jgi:hypothetical protein
MESGYAYPERSGDNPAAVCENAKAETDVRINNDRWNHQKSAEVIVGRKRAIERMEVSHTNRRTEC